MSLRMVHKFFSGNATRRCSSEGRWLNIDDYLDSNVCQAVEQNEAGLNHLLDLLEEHDVLTEVSTGLLEYFCT